MFDLSTKTWTFITGNQTSDIEPDYEVPYPGTEVYTTTIDFNTGILYIFGGRDTTTPEPAKRYEYYSNETLSELWQFNLFSGEWQHLFGERGGNPYIYYDIPYGAGIERNAMAMDTENGYIYCFGGYVRYDQGIFLDWYLF